ncbi:MAG: helix-turn-helix domain-containing protein [Trebonia sp.]
MSERQLSRVFAADGTSIPRHILSRRLDLACSMLLNAADGGKAETVAAIAGRCGFTSATYFSHAFHQHFGHRPRDVRGQAATAGRQPS